MNRYFYYKLSLSLICLFLLHTGHTCTGLQLKALDGSIVRGRTMEFAQNLNSEVIVIPRGMTYSGSTPIQVSGLKWQTKYAATGANFNNEPFIIDGLNEKGLSAGAFYFPDFVGYQSFNQAQSEKTLAPWELVTWILTNFATLDEVKQALPDILVANVTFSDWKADVPLHYIVYDTKGKSLVIEYVKGKLNIYDNPIGVLTNSPGFEWHLTNLRNYINLSPKSASDQKINSLKLTPLGQGSGMLGLPGDFTPPSRFIRVAVYAASASPQKDAPSTVFQLFHILNNFDIPLGAVRSQGNNITSLDRTQWTTVCDLANRRFYYHTEHNSRLRVMDLMKCDLNAKKIIKFKMESAEKVRNITKWLK